MYFIYIFFGQSWEVFQEITEILILVPAVLGMKGNLEMTLASRLSTAVSVILHILLKSYKLEFKNVKTTTIHSIK